MEEFLKIARGSYRLVLCVSIVVTFLAWSFICHFFVRDPMKRLKVFSSNSHFFCGIMLAVLQVRLKVLNKPAQDEKFLLVSNHMGFLDILMMASSTPAVFITSIEMRETPLLGLITEMGGCFFVERRSRTKILDEMKGIVSILQKGFRVVLYPEATATNGEQVLPFKRTLMMAAAHAGVPIQPAVVNFRKINGESFSLKNRDNVCWHGDISFVVSMWSMITTKSIDAEIEFLNKIVPTTEDDRGLIADQAHQMISSKFVPARSPSLDLA